MRPSVTVRRRHRGLVPALAASAVALVAGTLAGCGDGGGVALPQTPQTSQSQSSGSGPTVLSTITPTPTRLPSVATTGSADAVPMPVGDIPGWHEIFTDDFATDVPVGGFSGCQNDVTRICTGLPASVAAKWWAYPDGWTDTSGKGTYMPSKTISIENGMMHLHLYTADGVHMVAAPVPRLPNPVGTEGGQLYGRYAIRFMVAHPTDSYKLAWLLWPDTESFPGDGEIDFPEGELNADITAFMHRQNGVSQFDQDEYATTVPISSGWHTAIIEWTPTVSRFILDGTTIGTSTYRIPDTPMHWVIQSETNVDGDVSNTATGDIYIAWVAIYQPT